MTEESLMQAVWRAGEIIDRHAAAQSRADGGVAQALGGEGLRDSRASFQGDRAMTDDAELIARATEAFAAYRGLGKEIVVEIIGRLAAQAQEIDRLHDLLQRERASHLDDDMRRLRAINAGLVVALHDMLNALTEDELRAAQNAARAALAKASGDTASQSRSVILPCS